MSKQVYPSIEMGQKPKWPGSRCREKPFLFFGIRRGGKSEKLRGHQAKWTTCWFRRIKEAVIRIPCLLAWQRDRVNLLRHAQTEHRTRSPHLTEAFKSVLNWRQTAFDLTLTCFVLRKRSQWGSIPYVRRQLLLVTSKLLNVHD
jgi:hypothetical protein